MESKTVFFVAEVDFFPKSYYISSRCEKNRIHGILKGVSKGGIPNFPYGFLWFRKNSLRFSKKPYVSSYAYISPIRALSASSI